MLGVLTPLTAEVTAGIDCVPRQVGLPQHFPRRPFPTLCSPGGGLPASAKHLPQLGSQVSVPFPSPDRRGAGVEGGCALGPRVAAPTGVSGLTIQPKLDGLLQLTAGTHPSGTEHPGETTSFSFCPLTREEKLKIIWHESANTLVAPHCHFLKVLCGGAEGNFRTSQIPSSPLHKLHIFSLQGSYQHCPSQSLHLWNGNFFATRLP